MTGSSEHDISIGAPSLRGLRSKPISSTNVSCFSPVIVGGGKPAFRTALRWNLELLQKLNIESFSAEFSPAIGTRHAGQTTASASCFVR